MIQERILKYQVQHHVHHVLSAHIQLKKMEMVEDRLAKHAQLEPIAIQRVRQTFLLAHYALPDGMPRPEDRVIVNHAQLDLTLCTQKDHHPACCARKEPFPQ